MAQYSGWDSVETWVEVDKAHTEARSQAQRQHSEEAAEWSEYDVDAELDAWMLRNAEDTLRGARAEVERLESEIASLEWQWRIDACLGMALLAWGVALAGCGVLMLLEWL